MRSSCATPAKYKRQHLLQGIGKARDTQVLLISLCTEPSHPALPSCWRGGSQPVTATPEKRAFCDLMLPNITWERKMRKGKGLTSLCPPIAEGHRDYITSCSSGFCSSCVSSSAEGGMLLLMLNVTVILQKKQKNALWAQSKNTHQNLFYLKLSLRGQHCWCWTHTLWTRLWIAVWNRSEWSWLPPEMRSSIKLLFSMQENWVKLCNT